MNVQIGRRGVHPWICVSTVASPCSSAVASAPNLTGHGDDWATGNRIMCDFLHRGIVLPGPCVPAGHSIDALVDEPEAA